MSTPRKILESDVEALKADRVSANVDVDAVVENFSDESQILSDQDQTTTNPNELDENMGAVSRSLEPMEAEPADFMRGEVDVKRQMDRAQRAMEDKLHGIEPEAPPSEENEFVDAAKGTPGGIDEVIIKEEQEKARKAMRNLH